MGQVLVRLLQLRGSTDDRVTVEPNTYDGPDSDILSPLPPEVVDMIIDYLPRQAILSCLRVNSLFYSVVHPRLCRRLQIRSDPAAEHGLSCAGVIETSRARNSHISRPQTPSSLTRKWIPEFVQCLELYPHRTPDCDECRNLFVLPWYDVPYRILRLNLSTDGPVLHVDAENAARPSDDQAWFACNALRSFARVPDTVVIRDMSGYHDGSEGAMLLDGKGVKHMVFVLRETFARYIYSALFVDSIPTPDIETITIVFGCARDTTWAPIPPTHRWSDFDCQRWLDRMLRTLVLSFIQVLSSTNPPRPVRLTLVNTARIHPRYLPLKTSTSTSTATPASAFSATTSTSPVDVQAEISKSLVDRARSIVPEQLSNQFGLKGNFHNVFRTETLEEFVASAPGVLAPEDIEAWI